MGRVLVVDDNRDLADTTAALLRAHDLEVMTLYEGVGVLSEVDRRVPDVIVLDIVLPGVGGVDLARRIRERYGNAVRLIACTAYGDGDTRQKMLQAGFAAIFIKPVTTADLLNAIATAPVGRDRAIAVRTRAATATCDAGTRTVWANSLLRPRATWRCGERLRYLRCSPGLRMKCWIPNPLHIASTSGVYSPLYAT